MDKHKMRVENASKEYNKEWDIDGIQKNHHYLRYDYISETFQFYEGRQKCFEQERSDKFTFDLLMDMLYDHMHYEITPQGVQISVTGGYELRRSWFPYSGLYHSSSAGATPLEKATDELISFLLEQEYFEINLDAKKQEEVMDYIQCLAQKYGQKQLGFGRTIPTTLKPALKYFSLEVTATSKHAKCDQIIHALHTTDQS